jgi:hypothetical protein
MSDCLPLSGFSCDIGDELTVEDLDIIESFDEALGREVRRVEICHNSHVTEPYDVLSDDDAVLRDKIGKRLFSLGVAYGKFLGGGSGDDE